MLRNPQHCHIFSSKRSHEECDIGNRVIANLDGRVLSRGLCPKECGRVEWSRKRVRVLIVQDETSCRMTNCGVCIRYKAQICQDKTLCRNDCMYLYISVPAYM